MFHFITTIIIVHCLFSEITLSSSFQNRKYYNFNTLFGFVHRGPSQRCPVSLGTSVS